MSISFSCKSCHKTYSVKDELAGKKAKCKQCGQTITIPRPVVQDELDPPDIGFLDEVVATQAAAAPVAAPALPKSSNLYAQPDYDAPAMPHRMPLKPSQTTETAVQNTRRYTTINDAKVGTKGANIASKNVLPYAAKNQDPNRDPALERDAMRATIGCIVLVFLIAFVVPIASGKADDPTMWGVSIGVAVAVIFAIFAIIAPATMGGVWLSCKIFGQGVPARLYFRSAGAVLTGNFLTFLVGIGIGVAGGLLTMAGLPSGIMIPLQLINALISLYIWFYVYNKYFSLGMGGTIVAAILSGVLVAVVFVPVLLIVMASS